MGVAKWRKGLNDWQRGPSTPYHDERDLQHFTTYIERRAVVMAGVGFLAVIGIASLISEMLWGYSDRLFVGILATVYWYPAWHLYMRKHYRPEFRSDT